MPHGWLDSVAVLYVPLPRRGQQHPAIVQIETRRQDAPCIHAASAGAAGTAEHAEACAMGMVECHRPGRLRQRSAEVEVAMMRDQRAGDHPRRRFAPPVHHHAAAGAHDRGG